MSTRLYVEGGGDSKALRTACREGFRKCHLMVQVMESWFLADRPALGDFFGQRFQESALPGNPHVKMVAKGDILDGLERASRSTNKGAYAKGKHSFEILARVDPAKLSGAAPYAKRFLDILRATAGAEA